jgi:hypothetical protein
VGEPSGHYSPPMAEHSESMIAHLHMLVGAVYMYRMDTAIPFNSVNVIHCMSLVEQFCAEVELPAL